MGPGSGTIPPFLLLVLELLLLVLLFPGCGEKDLRLRQAPPRAGESAQACGECHRIIYQEWKSSSHADSWTSQDFMSSLAETGTLDCWPCHAPEYFPPLSPALPSFREINTAEGVHCLACHGPQCPGVLPPGEEKTRAMAMEALWTEDPSALCGVCHRDTYEEWRAASGDGAPPGAEKTCAGCHMPKGSEGKRNHALPDLSGRLSPFLELRGLSAWPAPTGLMVEFEVFCDNLGHRLPTGAYGIRELRLEAWMENDPDQTRQSKRLFVELGNALQPGLNGPYRFLFQGGSLKKLHIRILKFEGRQRTETTLAWWRPSSGQTIKKGRS